MIDKKSLSERDICSKYITPALQHAGWNIQTQILEEVSFTDGKIYVRGKLTARGERKRTDYLLYYQDNPIDIKEKASEDGRLFGSITTKQIAEEVEKQLDIKIDKRKINQRVQMRSVGSQEVEVKLHTDVTAKLLVRVEGIEP